MLSHFPLIHLAYTAAHSPNTIPLSLATITLVQSTTNRFAAKVEQLANVSDGLADEVANFRNLFELSEMAGDLVDGTVPFESEGQGMAIEFRCGHFQDLLRASLTFRNRNVSFTYSGASRPSVRDLSFELRPGQLAVVVGINGGGSHYSLPVLRLRADRLHIGKSTMIKLLNRLYDPSTGKVLVNDRDARSYRTKELRAAIAVGWQDYCHFPLTVTLLTSFST